MFQQRNAKNPGVIYLRKFFLIFGELYTGLLKYFHGKFKFFSMKKKTLQYFMPSIAPTLFSLPQCPWFCLESVVINNTEKYIIQITLKIHYKLRMDAK